MVNYGVCNFISTKQKQNGLEKNATKNIDYLTASTLPLSEI